MVAIRTGDKGGEGAGQSERRIKDHWAGWTVARVRNSLVKARTCEPRPPRNSRLIKPTRWANSQMSREGRYGVQRIGMGMKTEVGGGDAALRARGHGFAGGGRGKMDR